MPKHKHPARLRLGRDQLSWYWKRIKNVPLAEYPYRIDQLAKKTLDKYIGRFSPGTSCALSDLDIRPVPDIQFRQLDPDDTERVLNAAERAIRGQFRYFGMEVEFPDGIDWHRDTKTGRSWPLVYWGDIDYRNASVIGGIKFAWELNRLHHFPVLALATAVSGDSRYIDAVFQQLDSWVEQNPYPMGINWISGIELGIRLVNLLYTLKICPNSINSGRLALISRFVHDHGRHLHRYPSKYTSAQNHALAEAIGLFVAGSAFPGLESSKKWKLSGKAILEREVKRQIQPDGSCFEHSIPYLQFICDHFLIYKMLCSDYGEDHSADVDLRLRASFRFIDEILDKNGNFAMIGDDDSGYLLRLWDKDFNNFRSLLNSCAILFPDLPLSHHEPQPDLKTILLVGGSREHANHRADQPATGKRIGNKHFKDCGLTTIRINDPFELLLVCNGGPLGLPPLAAHGHADALSFWLSIDGQPIFVDPGTYLYHSGGIWRDYFRSTAAHNTVRIDGLDQATILTDFIYEDFYDVYDTTLEQASDLTLWSAKHNGYHRLTDPVTHHRSIKVIHNPSSIRIQDHFSCKEPHFAELYFHLHPDCEVRREHDRFTIQNGEVAVTLQVQNKQCEIEDIYGDDNARGGWYSSAFNLKQPAHTLKFSFDLDGSTELESRIHWTRNAH